MKKLRQFVGGVTSLNGTALRLVVFALVTPALNLFLGIIFLLFIS
jgi:hypothetical protein